MESIEVWIWVLIGLFITSIIIPIFLNFINSVIDNQNINLARESLDKLSNSINNACVNGFFSLTKETLQYPNTLETLYVKKINQNDSELCIKLKNSKKQYCNYINYCNVRFSNISIKKDLRMLLLYDKMFKTNIPYYFNFKIKKETGSSDNNVPGSIVNWSIEIPYQTD